MLDSIPCGSALGLRLFLLEPSESAALESVISEPTCFAAELEGSESSDSLSLVSESDGVEAPSSPIEVGDGVLLGSFV